MSTPAQADSQLILELVSQKIASSPVSPVIILLNTQGEQGRAGKGRGQLSFLIEINKQFSPQ